MKIQWNSIIAMGLKDREFNRHNRVCIHFILIYFYRNSPDIVITELVLLYLTKSKSMLISYE
ncbi:hypothetical protein T4D_16377 [Trichinella pseudospiralis]|uniref:Uncharacterized protein n=1 Tax=Trichinella pseudospiralis TaxID=6337 RepID=A0A0V1FF82_TRIPS|nr:hypothetical protein T4D_16377 [Trichinella pseudospiralis]